VFRTNFVFHHFCVEAYGLDISAMNNYEDRR
jgi:hypothetical protein